VTRKSGLPLEHFRFFRNHEMLDRFVLAQFRTESRFALFLELL
jgi:hypothetical protein